MITFRELTKKVISAEKDGFYSDWTKEQQKLYESGDWEAFSRSRGYTEEEIADFMEWVKMSKTEDLTTISDLVCDAALKNISKDTKCEILKSSHVPDYQDGITSLEKTMRSIPGCIDGKEYPLKHSFAENMYVREIFVPKGHLVITKIHKTSHPVFVLSGDCSVMSEDGVKRVKAPCYMITPAGTKRVVYVHEDTVWVTVHATKETDLDKIEDEVIAKTFDDVKNNIIDTEIVEFIEQISKEGV